MPSCSNTSSACCLISGLTRAVTFAVFVAIVCTTFLLLVYHIVWRIAIQISKFLCVNFGSNSGALMSTPPKTCDAGIKEKAIGKIAFQNPSYMDRYFAAYCKVTIFSAFPTLASGASIARGCPPPFGGAHLAPSLRSRWDRIGQKPEPTFH